MSQHKCSRCKQVFGSHQALNAHKGQKHDTHVEVECEVCGDSFDVTESRQDSARFCSYDCMGEDQTERWSDGSNPNRADVSTSEIVEEYQSGLSAKDVGEKFGLSDACVYWRLDEAGVETRDADYGHDQKTSFGLEVRSGMEAVTAEWLDRFGPEEWKYEPKDFPGPYVPDFVLGGDKVMEVWGVISPRYESRRERKEEWYSEEGYELISVESQDINEMKKMMRVSK